MTETEVVAGEVAPLPTKTSSSYVGDVLKLASGTAVGQALSILLAPVLARIFAPEAFGTAAVFTSLLSVIGAVVCLRYQFAIMLPEKDEDAASLVVGSLFFVGMFAAMTTLGVLFLREPIARWLKAPDLEPTLWLLPIAVLATGATSVFRYWNTRMKRFGLLWGTRIAGSVSGSAAKLGLGLLGYVAPGALIGGNVPVVFDNTVGMTGLCMKPLTCGQPHTILDEVAVLPWEGQRD